MSVTPDRQTGFQPPAPSRTAPPAGFEPRRTRRRPGPDGALRPDRAGRLSAPRDRPPARRPRPAVVGKLPFRGGGMTIKAPRRRRPRRVDGPGNRFQPWVRQNAKLYRGPSASADSVQTLRVHLRIERGDPTSGWTVPRSRSSHAGAPGSRLPRGADGGERTSPLRPIGSGTGDARAAWPLREERADAGSSDRMLAAFPDVARPLMGGGVRRERFAT